MTAERSSEAESQQPEEKKNGQEGCQGREEEGREEALVSSGLTFRQGVLSEHPIFFARRSYRNSTPSQI